MLRSKNQIKIGIAGSDKSMLKLKRESMFVNGCQINDIYLTEDVDFDLAGLNKVNSFKE